MVSSFKFYIYNKIVDIKWKLDRDFEKNKNRLELVYYGGWSFVLK